MKLFKKENIIRRQKQSWKKYYSVPLCVSEVGTSPSTMVDAVKGGGSKHVSSN